MKGKPVKPAGPHIQAINEGSSSNNLEPTSSAIHAQNPPASVSDAASADPANPQKELAAQKDDYMRLAADCDNLIKRTQRDSGQQAAMEKEAFIRDLLPILDNLERALASEQSNSSEPLLQGVTMTLQQVGQLLGRHLKRPRLWCRSQRDHPGHPILL